MAESEYSLRALRKIQKGGKWSQSDLFWVCLGLDIEQDNKHETVLGGTVRDGGFSGLFPLRLVAV